MTAHGYYNIETFWGNDSITFCRLSTRDLRASGNLKYQLIESYIWMQAPWRLTCGGCIQKLPDVKRRIAEEHERNPTFWLSA